MTQVRQSPVFLIGTGRCGSTIVYSTLAMHPAFAWIPSWLTPAPRWPILSAGNRIWNLPGTDGWREARFMPKPVELNAVWKRWVPDFFREDAPDEVVEATRATLIPLLERICRYQGKPRYLGKVAGRPVKVELLAEVFPEARFVLVTRDLRPTVSSLLLVDFYQRNVPLREWPWAPIPDEMLEFHRTTGSSEEIAAAITVVLNQVELERQLALIDSTRWIEISYSEFVAKPIDTLRRMGAHAAFPIEASFEKRVLNRGIQGGADSKWTKHFTPEQIGRLDEFEKLVDRLLGDRPALHPAGR